MTKTNIRDFFKGLGLCIFAGVIGYAFSYLVLAWAAKFI